MHKVFFFQLFWGEWDGQKRLHSCEWVSNMLSHHLITWHHLFVERPTVCTSGMFPLSIVKFILLIPCVRDRLSPLWLFHGYLISINIALDLLRGPVLFVSWAFRSRHLQSKMKWDTLVCIIYPILYSILNWHVGVFLTTIGNSGCIPTIIAYVRNLTLCVTAFLTDCVRRVQTT